jgi:hypothetical protein
VHILAWSALALFVRRLAQTAVAGESKV